MKSKFILAAFAAMLACGTAQAQQINVTRRFYADVNPQLSIQQQARLKVYMDSTEQDVRQAIQKSR